MPRLGRRKREQLSPQEPINWLELMLCKWEDMWFIYAITDLVARMTGQMHISRASVLQHAKDFRDFLLRCHQPDDNLKLENFLSPNANRPKWMDNGMTAWMDEFAKSVVAWTISSRRIFRIDRQLQSLLQMTSLDKVTWGDILPLPFASFAIELAIPYTDHIGRQFSFLLLRTVEGVDCPPLQLQFFGTAGDGSVYKPLTTKERADVKALVDQRMGHQAGKEVVKFGHRVYGHTGFTLIEFEPLGFDELIIDTADRLNNAGSHTDQWTPQSHQEWNVMFRAIAGLVLYLKTLPAGSPHISPPTKPFRSGLLDRKVITNRWEVCNVTSVIPLTREERIFYGIEGNQEEQRQAKYELSCHFREGHWRRPPGRGDDPTAPRTVHVRPCIVRRDRLPKDGGLPAGIIKSDLDT